MIKLGFIGNLGEIVQNFLLILVLWLFDKIETISIPYCLNLNLFRYLYEIVFEFRLNVSWSDSFSQNNDFMKN